MEVSWAIHARMSVNLHLIQSSLPKESWQLAPNEGVFSVASIGFYKG